jgi:hypothetical protein
MPKGSTDRRFRRHLKALTAASNLQANQPVNRARTDIPVSSNLVRDQNPENTAGGGVSGTVVEPDYNARTYFAALNVIAVSSDGLFTIEAQPIKTITFEDADENVFTLEFDEPGPP